MERDFRATLRKVFFVLREQKVCLKYGWLYHCTVEHFRDAMQPNEDIEMLRKCDFEEIRKLILSEIADNESYEIADGL